MKARKRLQPSPVIHIQSPAGVVGQQPPPSLPSVNSFTIHKTCVFGPDSRRTSKIILSVTVTELEQAAGELGSSVSSKSYNRMSEKPLIAVQFQLLIAIHFLRHKEKYDM